MDSPFKFPSTHWTVLEQKRNTPQGRAWFCENYRPAVLAYLRSRMDHHAADDLCQEFFASVVLDRNLLETADRNRGRLRSLLLTALERFLINQHRRTQAEKRGGRATHQSLDAPAAHGNAIPLEDFSAEMPDQAFDRAWAIALMDRALAATGEDCRKMNKGPLFEFLRPLLDGSGPARPHTEIAGELGLTTREVTLALSRLRQRVANHLYAEVALTVEGKESIPDEWESVRQALQGH